MATEPAASTMKGLPLMRFYPFDDIGDVSRGAQLLFDRAGRIAVVHDGVYLVLNDDVWLPVEIQSSDAITAQRVESDSDGTCYYGSLGSWGMLTPTERGTLHLESLTPADCPKWAAASSFTDILCRPEGVYFVCDRGVVFWDRNTQKTLYFDLPTVAFAFPLENRIYVSSHSRGTFQLDVHAGTFQETDRDLFKGAVIDHIAQLEGRRALVTTTGRNLLLYDGGRITQVNSSLGTRLAGRVTALHALPDGTIAAAINGQGLYIINAAGDIITALTQPEYRSISALATNEEGVLWASTEGGVAKILYGASVTTFGQALGLPIGWPQIVSWEGMTVMASNGRAYETEPGRPGEPARFRLMPDQPLAGTWGIATWKQWLLLANYDGVFALQRGGQFQRISSGADRLVMLGPDTCLAVSRTEIAALRFDGQNWSECAPRVPGIGFPSLVHSSKNAAWLELGANRAGRIALVEGKITTQVFDSFPWREPQWINVSIVGDVAVLIGREKGYLFVDDKTGEPLNTAALAKVMALSPYPVARIREDPTGRLWVSHAHGVFTLKPGADGYIMDLDTYRVVPEHWPTVQPVNGDLWISSARSLYHVSSSRPHTLARATRPRLVSVRDAKTDRELVRSTQNDVVTFTVPYSQNSLAFRFFAGSYGARRTPDYEFRLNDEKWTRLDSSAVLRLSDLREGAYRLGIRLFDTGGPVGNVSTVSFSIAPPWQRTWLAFAIYLLLGIALIYGLVRLMVYRVSARNLALERIVERRTEELKATMKQLERETRTAATLAERNRLAGEIHDSLEQGFSGLVLHLDTTAGFSDCPPFIKQALTVARNMVAFSRNEVRHAVWDLHSPLLEEGDLSAALTRLVTQCVPDPARAHVSIEGQPCPLSSTVEHHLLRIAQEAVANAVKHARAEKLEVKLIYAADEICLKISDDGCGFDTQAIMAGHQNGHFGLRSLRSRAAKIGATIEIVSTPEIGTNITIRVPLSAVPS